MYVRVHATLTTMHYPKLTITKSTMMEFLGETLSFSTIQDAGTLTTSKDVLDEDLVPFTGVEVEQRQESSGELKLVRFKWNAG